MKEKGKECSFIVHAKQPIEIGNISSYQNDSNNICKFWGFFYSEDELEIYVVGSKIRIEGGISAKKVNLNAIKGRATRGSGFPGAQRILAGYEGFGFNSYSVYDYFESEIVQKKSAESRLQIIYNPDIITTYSELKEQEPTITRLANPEIKSRE